LLHQSPQSELREHGNDTSKDSQHVDCVSDDDAVIVRRAIRNDRCRAFQIESNNRCNDSIPHPAKLRRANYPLQYFRAYTQCLAHCPATGSKLQQYNCCTRQKKKDSAQFERSPSIHTFALRLISRQRLFVKITDSRLFKRFFLAQYNRRSPVIFLVFHSRVANGFHFIIRGRKKRQSDCCMIERNVQLTYED